VEREAEAWGSYAVTRRSPNLGRHPPAFKQTPIPHLSSSRTTTPQMTLILDCLQWPSNNISHGKTKNFAFQASRLSCSRIRADEATLTTNKCIRAIERRSGPVTLPQDMESKTMTSADCSKHSFTSPNAEKHLIYASPYNIIFVHLYPTRSSRVLR